MPSPFPGMDPYLEGWLWPDVHATLIPAIRAALAARLPEVISPASISTSGSGKATARMSAARGGASRIRS
jgi:hypothetical protein